MTLGQKQCFSVYSPSDSLEAADQMAGGLGGTEATRRVRERRGK